MRWIAVLFCLFITACTSTSTTQDSRGATTQTLFKNWGYPNRIARLPGGRCLLIYTRKGSPCRALFKVSREKRIISVKYKGGRRCWKLFREQY